MPEGEPLEGESCVSPAVLRSGRSDKRVDPGVNRTGSWSTPAQRGSVVSRSGSVGRVGRSGTDWDGAGLSRDGQGRGWAAWQCPGRWRVGRTGAGELEGAGSSW